MKINKPTITAGESEFYSMFQLGSQTANATYTLPLSMPDGDKVLQSTNSGVMSWVAASSGTGDVVGPGSSTNEGIVRFNGTTGKSIQNSLVIIGDDGYVSIPSGQKYKINGVNLSATDVGAEPTLTKYNLSETASGVLTITGGPSSVVTNAVTIQVNKASASQDGYLAKGDWTIFNNKASGVPTSITVANESTDTTCFPLFVTNSAAGDYGPKTTTTLAFNSNTGSLSSSLFSADTITANTAFVPDANDGAAIGTTALQFSDLFLATGAVIDYNNGTSTITHSANTLTIGGSGATTLALGSNNLTMTGSIGATGARVTKGWFADLESTAGMKITAAPASDHSYSGTTITLNANENQAFGDVCFVNADGQAQLIDTSAIATSSGIVMAVESISANNDGLYLLSGTARDDSWSFTVGGLIFGSETGSTGNTLTQTAPTAANSVTQILGVATHADRMLFKPSLVQVEHV